MTPRPSTAKRRVVSLMVAFGLAIAFTGCSESARLDRSETRAHETAGPDPIHTEIAFDQPKQKMPKNGKEVWLTRSNSYQQKCQKSLDRGRTGRLQISVPRGDETYFVKLKGKPRESYLPGVDTFGVAVRAGRTVTVDVPLCGEDRMIYDLYYGAGTAWYGFDYLFGPEGTYSRTSEQFPFEKGAGWSVELILQPGGNLGSAGLDYDEFIG